MASISGVLQDNDGNDLYPYTFDQEVLDANNVPISQRLGSASEASAVAGSSAFAKINTLSSELTSQSETRIINQNGTVGTSFVYSSLSFTLTRTSSVRILQRYNDASPSGIGISSSSSAFGQNETIAKAETSGYPSYLSAILPPGTYYIWLKASGAGSNVVQAFTIGL